MRETMKQPNRYKQLAIGDRVCFLRGGQDLQKTDLLRGTVRVINDTTVEILFDSDSDFAVGAGTTALIADLEWRPVTAVWVRWPARTKLEMTRVKKADELHDAFVFKLGVGAFVRIGEGHYGVVVKVSKDKPDPGEHRFEILSLRDGDVHNTARKMFRREGTNGWMLGKLKK